MLSTNLLQVPVRFRLNLFVVDQSYQQHNVHRIKHTKYKNQATKYKVASYLSGDPVKIIIFVSGGNKCRNEEYNSG